MIVDLKDKRALDASLTGGKASKLALLIAEGFPTPPGFAITTEALAAFVDENELGPQVDALFEDAGADAGALQEKIRSLPLPAGLANRLKEELDSVTAGQETPVRFAVRSSGVAEDLAGASFAGQYDTVLGAQGFDEVASATLVCWASFFNSHSIKYRRDRGIREFRGAVVVQRLVEADAAGVSFTLLPDFPSAWFLVCAR